jgi:anti-anti-sigma regulatory factor
MLVFAGQRFCCVKIIGRANFTSSIDFRTFVNEMREKGYGYFVLDLSECVLMDSTFLGVLAGLGLKLGAQNNGADGIELLNPNARITELLESLGVLHLFRLKQNSGTPSPTAEAECLKECQHSPEEVTRACLEAHQTLMQVNEENVPRFKDVAHFLAEDLKKQQAAKN